LEKSYKRIREDNTKIAANKIWCEGAIKILYTALLLDHCPVKEINFDFTFVSALAVSLSMDGFLLLLFLKGGTKRHPQAPSPHGSAFYSKPNGPTSPYGCTVPSLVGNACLSVTL